MDMAGVTIVPLGNIAPPDHILPTSHIYFTTSVVAPPRTVVAPADGQIQYILTDALGASLGIRNGSYLYYMGRVKLDTGINQGTIVHAGQRLGTTVAELPELDFGLVNYQTTVGFVNPARYVDEQLHCDTPISYFTEPLRSQMYAVTQRITGDKDGQINFDVQGRLVGNWFLDGLAAIGSVSQAPAAWPQQLAFAYDNYDPAHRRVVIGSALSLPGAFEPAAGSIDFKDVSVSSGQVVYQLSQWGAPGQPPGPPRGVMIVQMLDDARVRVETLPGSSDTNPTFSAAARIYVR